MLSHIMGIFWAHRVGWTYFGHIFDTFGLIVSKMCLYVHRAPAPNKLRSHAKSDSFGNALCLCCDLAPARTAMPSYGSP